jgi:16S rRNA (adenine1518-N6/adenine1519-N6)-dimethyltransferase
MVQPKKHLGQHFLRDQRQAQKIAAALSLHGNYRTVLEIGPGTGVLTQYLLENSAIDVYALEIDRESIPYLHEHFPQLSPRLIEGDVLNYDPDGSEMGLPPGPFAVAGNFPYNISSQILFKVLDWKQRVPEVVGMFQKEVAERVVSKPGSKVYGILSVLIQAWYKAEYLFTVEPGAFHPPPKVRSGVIRLQRNGLEQLPCNEALFVQLVKAAFNQRRKTMRNSIRGVRGYEKLPADLPQLQLRPEQMSVSDFISLCQKLEA